MLEIMKTFHFLLLVILDYLDHIERFKSTFIVA